MFTFHLSSRLSSRVRGGLALCWILLAMALAAQAQTKASCTFKFFSPTTPFKLHNGNPVFIQSLGINDFGTIVGYSIPGPIRGLIRSANGRVTHVKGTTFLEGLNDQGTIVGDDLTSQGVSVNGSTITPIVLGVNNGGVAPNGINNYGTIIGRYIPPSLNANELHGFKRFSNGTTHTLDFPGAVLGETQPMGINDNGFVVGVYESVDGVVHGFIFHKAQWATLDYPHALFTVLVGITNDGKIIGTALTVDFSTKHFLYENGTFKVISIPDANPSVADFRSVSPRKGLILGLTTGNAGDPAFIAQCH
jgi:hypothetical protein